MVSVSRLNPMLGFFLLDTLVRFIYVVHGAVVHCRSFVHSVGQVGLLLVWSYNSVAVSTLAPAFW